MYIYICYVRNRFSLRANHSYHTRPNFERSARSFALSSILQTIFSNFSSLSSVENSRRSSRPNFLYFLIEIHETSNHETFGRQYTSQRSIGSSPNSITVLSHLSDGPSTRNVHNDDFQRHLWTTFHGSDPGVSSVLVNFVTR